MNSFVAIDVETANTRRGSICQIGMAKFVDEDAKACGYVLLATIEKAAVENARLEVNALLK